MQVLILAGRVILAKLALVSHIILCKPRNSKQCAKIDRICRQFIWGSTETRRKLHLVNWNKICRPKKVGGLGFQKAKEVNLACMIKPAWGVVSKLECLWVKVIRNKYHCRENIIPNLQMLGEGFMKAWPQFKHNLIWRLRNGGMVRI